MTPEEVIATKKAAFGRYQKAEDDRAKLAMKVARKSLDIPEDDMTINANRHGVGPLAVIGVALASGLLPSLLAGWLLFRDAKPAAAAKPNDSDYEVRFFNAEGQPIRVDRFQDKKP